MLGYPEEIINRLPKSAVESFAGVGNPWAAGPVDQGWTVVDIGSGAGLDMTDAMLEKARQNAEMLGFHHVEFRKGMAEALPIEDASVDLVISNGVLNLVPDKDLAYQEVFRIVRPGGRVYIADVVIQKQLAGEDRVGIDLWTG